MGVDCSYNTCFQAQWSCKEVSDGEDRNNLKGVGRRGLNQTGVTQATKNSGRFPSDVNNQIIDNNDDDNNYNNNDNDDGSSQ